MAELHNLRVEAEVRERSAESAPSQEAHIFTQATPSIEEMRNNFTSEDQRCIRRIEMFQDQRNEYVSSLIAPGNHAEFVLHERHAEYSEEVNRLKKQAEAYVDNQMGYIKTEARADEG